MIESESEVRKSARDIRAERRASEKSQGGTINSNPRKSLKTKNGAKKRGSQKISFSPSLDGLENLSIDPGTRGARSSSSPSGEASKILTTSRSIQTNVLASPNDGTPNVPEDFQPANSYENPTKNTNTPKIRKPENSNGTTMVLNARLNLILLIRQLP